MNIKGKSKRQTRCLCSLRYESFVNTVKSIKIATFKREMACYYHSSVTSKLSGRDTSGRDTLHEIRLGLCEAPGAGPTSTFLPQHFFPPVG